MGVQRPSARWRRHSIVIGIALVMICTAREGGGAERADDQLEWLVNDHLGICSSRLIFLEIGRETAGPMAINLPLDGIERTLRLRSYSLRAHDYRLLAQDAEGWVVEMEAGTPRTLRGSVIGLAGSRVAGSLLAEGLYATILLRDGSRYWLEPIPSHFDGVRADLHVIYRNGHVRPTWARCGLEPRLAVTSDACSAAPPLAPSTGAPIAQTLSRRPCVAELANDADVEYFLRYGSVEAVQDRIALVTNIMNLQFEAEVAITHEITTTLVRTEEPDPYDRNSPFDLVCELNVEWTNNQTHIQRDLAQLFTGKPFGGVIGVAYRGQVCQNQGCETYPCECGEGAYCVVKSDYNENLACATDLSAHEIGHVWNATHCDCLGYTMHRFIQCANTFHLTSTRPTIRAHQVSRPCITCPTCPGDVDGDAFVTFDDLVMVLDTWGPCEGCDEDFNWDGVVGFDDLVILLGAWGPCPPTGRCCLSNGECVEGVRERDCSRGAGTFLPEGRTCEDCPYEGPCGWVAEAPMMWFGDTCNMDDTCDEGPSGDMQFEVAIPSDGTWLFSLCGADWDTVLAVGTTCCSENIALSDDAPGCGLSSRIIVALQAGTYFVTVDGAHDDDCGDFVLTVAQLP